MSGNRDPVYIAACLEMADEMQCSSTGSIEGRGSEGMGCAVVSQKYEEVLSAAQNQARHARLIAVAAPHSGDFLNVIPCSLVGTRLGDT